MAKSSTPSFITELPLKTSSWEVSVLRKRFFAAKQQYNALLGEALRRLKAMRADPEFGKAIALYKQQGKKLAAREIFKEVAIAHSYREYDLYAYCKQWNPPGNSLSIGSRISQQVAKRAFQAVEEYRKGNRGKPRFKGYRGLQSIEDNSIDANLRLKGTTLYYLGLPLPLLYDEKDPIHYHGMQAKHKYVRLVRRAFNGKQRYFAQLVCKGKPWVKSHHTSQAGVVGLDIGPQTIAIVAKEQQLGHLQVFADALKEHRQKKMQLQRKLSRQLRANNPACFEQDRWQKSDKHWHKKQGKVIRGKRFTQRSAALQTTSNHFVDLQRREAAHRKAQHGQLVNQILQLGSTIKTEKLSYRSFQKLYGKSVGMRAPGMFVEKLTRKAENAGGRVDQINTWKTKLSQSCHCGQVKKKPLSDRWHRCGCGVEAQRDLYSAYLACYVEEDVLMADEAQAAWSGMDIALRTAMRQIKQPISGPMPASLGMNSGQRLSCAVYPKLS